MFLDKMKDRIGDFEGKLGICYIDINSRAGFTAGNCDVFPASGVIKLLILIEAFKRLNEGEINKNDTYILKTDDYPKIREKSFSALEHIHIGAELTIEDLYKLNVIVSDNMAFNILLKLFGKDAVNDTLREFGFKKTRINRAINDYAEITKGVQNYVSVQEMANLLLRMYEGQIISNAASKEMLEILCEHQKTSPLTYNFLESMKIAHQSGYDDNEIHDMGIVYGENPFILCMASSVPNTKNAESVMRDITMMCYQNSNKGNPRLRTESEFADSMGHGF